MSRSGFFDEDDGMRKYSSKDDFLYEMLKSNVSGHTIKSATKKRTSPMQETSKRKRDTLQERNYYMMPTKIEQYADLAVIKAFYTGQATGKVVPVAIGGYLTMAFEVEADAFLHKASGWEGMIMELLDY